MKVTFFCLAGLVCVLLTLYSMCTTSIQAQTGASSRIFFLSTRHSHWGIFTMNPDGSGQKGVLVETNPDAVLATYYGLALAADGKQMALEFMPLKWGDSKAFLSLLQVNKEKLNDDRDVLTVERTDCLGLSAVVRIDCIKNLLSAPSSSFHPSFTPDSKKIAYSFLKQYAIDIYTVLLDGQSATNVMKDEAIIQKAMTGQFSQSKPIGFHSSGRKISFSTDGKKMVFSCKCEGSACDAADSDNQTEICVMNMDRTGFKRLTNNTFADNGPSFSQDGKSILFDSNRKGNFDVYIMNADGTGTKQLTQNPENDTSSCFSPDGKKIVFSVREGPGTASEIYIMNRDGSGQTNLTNSADDDYAPVFSGCSNWIRE